MRQIWIAGLGLALLAAGGCSGGGRKLVPVSGVVKVNGEPAANLVVSFQPLGGENEENPGRGSSAVTGPDGRYTLIYDGEKPGALNGKHRVRIFPQVSGGGKGEAPEGGEAGPARPVAYIPPEWNELSKVDFEVPEKGTDKADFDIPSQGPPKRK
jgi:hypothetical protein